MPDQLDAGVLTDHPPQARRILREVALMAMLFGIYSGAAWLSTVRLAGRPAIRLCITSHRTGPADIEAVVSALAEACKRTPIA